MNGDNLDFDACLDVDRRMPTEDEVLEIVSREAMRHLYTMGSYLTDIAIEHAIEENY